MSRSHAFALVLAALAFCSMSAQQSLDALCADMTAAGKRGENYGEALDRATKAFEASKPESEVLTLVKKMRNYASSWNVPSLRKYAVAQGLKFDCPGWEYRLGAPKAAVVATGKGLVGTIAIAGSSLYWLDNGTLMRSALDGSESVALHTVRSSGEDSDQYVDLVRLRIVGETIYWLAFERVWRMPLTGTVAEELGKTHHAMELAVDGTQLFVVDQPGIVRIDLATLKQEVIVEGQPDARFLHVEGGTWCWSGSHTEVRCKRPEAEAEAVGRTFELNSFASVPGGFWTADKTVRHHDGKTGKALNEVSTATWEGGAPTELAFSDRGAWATFAGDQRGWPNTGHVAQVTLTESPSATVIDAGYFRPSHLAFAEGWVYWASGANIVRMKVPAAVH